jgi:hypothetical protein
MSTPRSGACSPWIDGSAVACLPWVRDAADKLTKAGRLEPQELEAICAGAALAATDALYELSGRVFTGNCGPVTIRPLARPTDMDTRAWAGGLGGAWGGYSGYGLSYGGAITGAFSHYAKTNPPEVDLGEHPVTEIVQVKIDGEVIPADEYELRDHRRLVRLMTSASATPGARYGWPTSQVQNIPDTEPGTFSVTFEYGQPPPELGVVAATRLAEFLALPRLGDATHYPQRVRSMTRQGVSTMSIDVLEVLKAKATGIYEVDFFILTYNPGRNQRQARVFSPDRGKPRRTERPSLPA